MKNKKLTISEIKRKAVPLLKKYGIKRAGIFGSYARGDAKKKSDIDILVKTKKGTGLIEFAGIKVSLEEKLHRKVDLVEYDMIKPLIKKKS